MASPFPEERYIHSDLYRKRVLQRSTHVALTTYSAFSTRAPKISQWGRGLRTVEAIFYRVGITHKHRDRQRDRERERIDPHFR